MKIVPVCCAILFGCLQHSYAQETASTVDVKNEKKYNHYLGVQVNGLIRQVINFNNNASTDAVNPYLLVYSMNSVKSGWGVRVGLGYKYLSATSNDGVTKKESNNNSIQARLGIEKRFQLTDKWSAGVGLDGVINSDYNNTTATIHSFDTTITTTISKLPSMGGGAMGWLRYRINEHILVGTETSFYYLSGTEDNLIRVTQRVRENVPPFESTITTTETKSKPKFSEGKFTLPVVFYLTIRF